MNIYVWVPLDEKERFLNFQMHENGEKGKDIQIMFKECMINGL